MKPEGYSTVSPYLIAAGDAGPGWPAAFPSVEPERKEGEPGRRGGVRDPGGNTAWIATQVG